MPENVTLGSSYRHCRQLARAAARNFYYGFRLLPAAKRDALCALYAFMRGVDDISDEPGALEDKQQRLRERRAEMDRALAGHAGGNPVWRALGDTVTRYSIPLRYLHDLISGAEMDLTISSYEAFDALREYCYRVAGTVGLCCVHVFGFTDPQAPELAERLGVAFQLTNILRDVRKDFEMGRVYLPQEDFRRFGCHPGRLGDATPNPGFLGLMRFEAERAWEFYPAGGKLVDLVNEDSRAALWALVRIYAGLLEKIEAARFDVPLSRPARLSAARKVWILVRARMGWLGQNDAFRNRDRDWGRAGGTLGGHGAR